MGETVRHVARHRGRWLALLLFSAAALTCGARDRRTGWGDGVRSLGCTLLPTTRAFRFCLAGERNLGSRVLAPCARRLVSDWPARFGHKSLLAETLVDPAFRGTVYRAANRVEVGRTRGFARAGPGYNAHGRP